MKDGVTFMQKQVNLFSDLKQCEICGRPLPNSLKETLCTHCQETKLFQDVKEYIRSYDVNEYMVAERFNIPIKKVKGWIREGRIEYKDQEAQKTIEGLHCQKCGVPITFGTVCTKCMKLQNGMKGYENRVLTADSKNNKMRFLDKD